MASTTGALAALLAGDPSVAGVRNGADVLIKSLFIAVAGTRGPLLFMAVVIGVSLWLIRRDLRASGGRVEAWVFGGMVLESLALSFVFGLVVGIADLLSVPSWLDFFKWATVAYLLSRGIAKASRVYEY